MGLESHGSERLADTLRDDTALSPVPSFAWARANWHVFALVVIATASLALRVDIARNTSLWLDEIYTLRDVNRGLFRILVGPNPDHPGIMYAGTKLGMLVFGGSDAAVRAASLAFGTAVLFSVYLLSRELGFGRARAVFAVASLSLAPMFVRHAVEARHYAPLMLFTSSSLLAVLRIEREPDRKRHYLLLLGSTLATLFTHYYGATSIAAAYAGLAYVTLAAFRRRDANRAKLLRGFALTAGPVFVIGLLVALFRFTRIANHYGVGDGDASAGSVAGSLIRLLHEFSPVHSASFVAYAFAVFALLGLVEFCFTRRSAGVLLLVAVLSPVVGLVAIGNDVELRPRYAIAAFVVYYLLAIAGLSSAAEWSASGLARCANASRGRLGLASGVTLGLLIAARAAQFPAGYSAGTFYHAGLRDYLRSEGGRTALACYVGFVCQQTMKGRYAIDPPPIRLERFRKLPGVDRYLVAEFHADRGRRKRFVKLLERYFGISGKAWNALPLVDLPATRYQPSLRARLIDLRDLPTRAKKPAARKKKRARSESVSAAAGAP